MVDETAGVNRRKGKKRSVNWKKEIISWICIFIIAGGCAFILDTYIIANSFVPTGSMENTIMAESRIIGSRLTYRFSEPQRGDIAVFIFPDDKAKGITTYYVKRIIGLPGETIDIIIEITQMIPDSGKKSMSHARICWPKFIWNIFRNLKFCTKVIEKEN